MLHKCSCVSEQTIGLIKNKLAQIKHFVNIWLKIQV
jgi:hypothetical protein